MLILGLVNSAVKCSSTVKSSVYDEKVPSTGNELIKYIKGKVAGAVVELRYIL